MNALAATDALRIMQALAGLSLAVQTLEFLRLRTALSERGVWAWSVQQGDLAHASRATRTVFGFLSDERVHAAHLFLRLAGAAALILWGSALPVSLVLLLGTVAILVRWRGAFNGGSDFMTIAVLTGLVIADAGATFGAAETGAKAGLLYVAIQALTSYFVSGAVKLLDADWRTGRALPIFLDGAVHGPLPPTALLRRPAVAAFCSWGFILWECAAPLALVAPIAALGYCAVALVFHLLVFRFFGLNRFVFAWAAAFPAVVYAAGVPF